MRKSIIIPLLIIVMSTNFSKATCINIRNRYLIELKISKCTSDATSILNEKINIYYQGLFEGFPKPLARDILQREKGILLTARVIRYREINDLLPKESNLGPWQYDLSKLAEEYYYIDKPVIIDCQWDKNSQEYPLPYSCQYAQEVDKNGNLIDGQKNYLSFNYDKSELIQEYFMLTNELNCRTLPLNEIILAEEKKPCCDTLPNTTTTCLIGLPILIPAYPLSNGPR